MAGGGRKAPSINFGKIAKAREPNDRGESVCRGVTRETILKKNVGQRPGVGKVLGRGVDSVREKNYLVGSESNTGGAKRGALYKEKVFLVETTRG